MALAKSKEGKRAADAIDLGPLPGLIGYVLRRAQMVVFQDFFRTFARFAIRPAQFSVLTVIERNPGLKQSQVSAALGIKRTNFVGLLNTIEKRGLAERRPAAQDRRSYALYLTPAGEALMRKMRAALKAHEQRWIDRIGEDGRDALIALLNQLVTLDDAPAGRRAQSTERSSITSRGIA